MKTLFLSLRVIISSRLGAFPAITILLAGTLSGCSSVALPPSDSTAETSLPPVESREGERQVTDGTNQPEEDSTDSSTNTASSSAALVLLAQSESLRQEKKLPQAIALVERAIRLEPSRGDLWIQLGRLRYDEGEYARAEQYARRGIALTPSEGDARQKGWLLLADLSEAQGDLTGAQQIRSRWLNARG